MARPIKKGLDYHSMDVDFLHDIKIRKIIRRGGPTPVITYMCLLGLIYKNGYFIQVDSDLTFVISELTGINEEETIKNIGLLLDVDLISRPIFEKSNCYTSSGIQKRYVEICINSKRKVVISELIAINTEETHVNSEFSTQSKVKESKGKESKVNVPALTPEILQQSNLFRQPNIPEFQEVHRIFKQFGGNEEMARKFYDTNQATEWYLKGSPIKNVAPLISAYIQSWQKNENNKQNGKFNGKPDIHLQSKSHVGDYL